MTLSTRHRPPLAVALLAAVSALLGLWATAAPAQAGTQCGSTGCSKTYNDSGYGVLAIRDWTCGTGTTGTASTGCVSLANTVWLTRGQRTPAGHDYDAFQVDAGWCYKVELSTPFKLWTMTYNRIGQSSPVYVKVEDWGTARVKAQSSASCP